MYKSTRIFFSSLILFAVLLRSGPVEAAHVDTRNSEELSLGVSTAKLGQTENIFAAAVPNYEQANLTSSNAELTEDTLGFSVAIDGNTIVAGAPFEDSNATGINGDQSNNSSADSGAAYVFTRSGTIWSQPVFIKASNTDPDDEFGYSVAISGDTMVVGAPYEESNATGVNGDQADNSVSESGAVYVFVRSGNTWSQQAYIKASNTGSIYDNFGYAVAIDGNTLIVGAPGEGSNADGINGDQTNNSSPQAGAVYVFTRSGTIWSQQEYIKASNSGAYDEFGHSVGFSGNTLAVGAHLEKSNATGVNGDQTNNSALSAGAVYVFTRSGVTWSQQAYVKASNTNSFVYFGDSVSIDGDTLVVGSSGVDSLSGAAYVFSRAGIVWTQDAYLQASNKDNGDHFGKSVTVSGDTVVIGAFEESSSGAGLNGFQDDNSSVAKPYSGAAYLFTRNGATWSQQIYIKASDPYEFDKFGWAVALSGETLAVGSQRGGTFLGGGGPGAVYVFAYAAQPIFADVPFDYWSWQYVERLYTAGITGGCATSPSLIYCPDSTVTRAQMAIFLLRGIHGSSYTPPAIGSGSGFSDVPAGSFADTWIKELALEGITSGCGAGIYCPGSTVTRAQMAIFLLRGRHGASYTPPAVGSGTGFSDVPVGSFADAWIKQLAAEGITSGCTATTYCPGGSVTRAEMAIFLVRTFNLP